MEPGDLRPSPWFPSAPLIQKTAPISLKIASGLVSLVTLSSALPFSYPGSKFWKHPDKALKTESTHTLPEYPALTSSVCVPVCPGLHAHTPRHVTPDSGDICCCGNETANKRRREKGNVEGNELEKEPE